MSAADYYGEGRIPHQQEQQLQQHVSGAEQQGRPHPGSHLDGGHNHPSNGQQPGFQPIPHPQPSLYEPGQQQSSSPQVLYTQQPPLQQPLQASQPVSVQAYAPPEQMQYPQEKSKQGGGTGGCGPGLCACCACCTICAGFGLLESCEECVNNLDCATCVEGCC